MVTIYSYDLAKGKLDRPSISELPNLLEAENVDIWVDLESPSPDENEILRTIFDFHELAIEDCIETNVEEPKLDDYEDYLFIVLHSVFFKSEQLVIDLLELDIFFGRNYVVTYHKKPTFGLNQLKKRLDRGVDFMALGTDEILHTIVDSLVDNYVLSFKRLERMIYKIEAEILSDPTKQTFNDIFKLKIGLINLGRILGPSEEVMQSLGEAEHELIQEENKVYFQDVHDHISNIQGLLQSYMEMVTSTMNTYMILATHRMNSNMQGLTVIATIILIPTLVASAFGMNLILPFQQNPFGVFIVAGITVLLTAIMLLYFKKKGWF